MVKKDKIKGELLIAQIAFCLIALSVIFYSLWNLLVTDYAFQESQYFLQCAQNSNLTRLHLIGKGFAATNSALGKIEYTLLGQNLKECQYANQAAGYNGLQKVI